MTKSLKILVKLALLTSIAVSVRVFSFYIPIAGILGIRISFSSIPIFISGMLFGPFAGAMVGALYDLISFIVFPPTGAYFPGFTLSAAITGLIPGLIIFGKDRFTFNWVLITGITEGIITSVILNTLWLSILFGTPFIVLIGPRVFSASVMIPVQIFMVYTISKSLILLEVKSSAERG